MDQEIEVLKRDNAELRSELKEKGSSLARQLRRDDGQKRKIQSLEHQLANLKDSQNVMTEQQDEA